MGVEPLREGSESQERDLDAVAGDHAKLVKEGATIALRNGKSNVVNEHILLEMDRFGKVSVEDDSKVKSTNIEKNISGATWEKKAKQPDDQSRAASRKARTFCKNGRAAANSASLRIFARKPRVT